ncbi:FAD/NAD(P)-binding protein [Nonomuraea recticatena]|uniref:FAD/NAD(P)-binding protein n=1 Tax=Nonomuraea recticatena TaxID=46178 RepID=UPI0031F92DC7
MLVNAPPALMSIRHRDRGHYAAWLGERAPAHLDGLLGQPLVPRALYGHYLRHTAETALAALRERGWHVRVHAARVTAMAASADRLRLRAEDGHVSALHRESGAVTLDDLIQLLRAELDQAGEDFDDFAADLLSARTDEPGRRLRRQLAAVDDPAIGRRVLQETAHALGPYAWRLLPQPDRGRLRRHFRLATSLASPMVPVNARVLMELLDRGQLTVAAGVREIQAAHGRFRLRCDDGTQSADVVVNAVNPSPQAVPHAAAQLVASLLAEDLAAPHPAGGLVPADPRLHVVGDLAGGGPFITSGILGVAAQAARTAQAVLTARAG